MTLEIKDLRDCIIEIASLNTLNKCLDCSKHLFKTRVTKITNKSSTKTGIAIDFKIQNWQQISYHEILICNTINLALDAIWRFPGMPEDFYRDWLQVAGEEALHFTLLHEHLQSLGFSYGDFDAHDGLWTMAERTAGDVLARMALVPRTLEARGLDATPPLQAKLARAGDTRAVEILDVILRDEVGHVRIGNRWYRHLCRERGLDPVALYPDLVERYEAPRLRPPFNFDAREAAGFSEEELAYLRS